MPVPGEPPPSLPPPLPPGARDAQEALRRERAVGDGKPRGRVTPLVYDFASEEERAAWEARYRKRWEDRLRRELEIKLRGLRERVGLQPHQEGALRRILQEELDERARLVGALSRKEITAAEFDAGVRENVRKARTALQELLTPEQREAYAALSPREQVLRDELK
ncbi:MAG: hypothetical protein D6731_11950 [Planctomycetota bacterium]|nr:MAG: hypothetical protein D6731_11950 [Planctomycetota bacterium]